MNISQLEDSIEKLQETFALDAYKPFLGVCNLNTSDALLRKRNQELMIKCKNLRCQTEVNNAFRSYFIIFNTSFKDDFGEHWFLILFNQINRNIFHVFNSFGLSDTVKAFGGELLVGGKETDGKDAVDKNLKRVNTLREIIKNIWGEEEKIEGKEQPLSFILIGVDGYVQDFSTDECGYHVYLFVHYLFKEMDEFFMQFMKFSNWWRGILSAYLQSKNLQTVPYLNLITNKYSTREDGQTILLENDRRVRQAVEKILKTKNRIAVHDEYDLTTSEWDSISKTYGDIYNRVIKSSSQDHTVQERTKTFSETIMPKTNSRGGKHREVLSNVEKAIIKKKSFVTIVEL